MNHKLERIWKEAVLPKRGRFTIPAFPSVKIVGGAAENQTVKLHTSPTQRFGASFLVGTGSNIHYFYFQIYILKAVTMKM
jgi:hypothetical protein